MPPSSSDGGFLWLIGCGYGRTIHHKKSQLQKPLAFNDNEHIERQDTKGKGETDMKPTIKADRSITIHRDNTVSYWNIRFQRWERSKAIMIPDAEMSMMTEDERKRIENAVKRYDESFD